MKQDLSKIKEISILLVDDEEFILETMSHFLQRRAKEVVTAADGREALQAFNDHGGFDIVVTDIEMPEMNGYDFYQAAAKDYPDARFIFLSGHTKGDIDPAYEDRTLYKPIDKDELIRTISSLL